MRSPGVIRGFVLWGVLRGRYETQFLAVRAAPKQFLGVGVEDIDNYVADLRNFGGSRGHGSSADSTPAPAAAESIGECLQAQGDFGGWVRAIYPS